MALNQCLYFTHTTSSENSRRLSRGCSYWNIVWFNTAITESILHHRTVRWGHAKDKDRLNSFFLSARGHCTQLQPLRLFLPPSEKPSRYCISFIVFSRYHFKAIVFVLLTYFYDYIDSCLVYSMCQNLLWKASLYLAINSIVTLINMSLADDDWRTDKDDNPSTEGNRECETAALHLILNASVTWHEPHSHFHISKCQSYVTIQERVHCWNTARIEGAVGYIKVHFPQSRTTVLTLHSGQMCCRKWSPDTDMFRSALAKSPKSSSNKPMPVICDDLLFQLIIFKQLLSWALHPLCP